jgi:hypothetical protein
MRMPELYFHVAAAPRGRVCAVCCEVLAGEVKVAPGEWRVASDK